MKTKYGSLEWIPQPSPGHWRARISLPDGTRPVVHFDPGLSEEKARDRARALSERANTGDLRLKRGPQGKTVADLVDSWLEIVEKSGVSPGTMGKDRSNAKRIKKVFGYYRPEDVTTAPLRKWIRDLKGEGLSPSHIVSLWGSLGKLFDTAMGEEWITLPANPCRHPGMKGVVPTVEEGEIVTLTPAQITRLLATAERGTRYLVAVTSGLRDAELSGLKWGDIREEGGVLVYDVQRNFTIRQELGPLKTRASRRLVPVHSSLVEKLNAIRAKFIADLPVFPGPDGGHYRPESAELTRYDLDLPSTSPITFHALRRTFSTWLDGAGVPENLRDRLMGHAARGVGNRRYTKVDLRRLQAAVETIHIDTISSQTIVGPPSTYAEPNGNEVSEGNKWSMTEGGQSEGPEGKTPPTNVMLPISKSAMAGGDGNMAATPMGSLERAIAVAAEAHEWDLVERLAILLERTK